jgi:UDP-GlcNAc:undecaprenyl-phosphate GlcNAc-1-phosphate transferase
MSAYYIGSFIVPFILALALIPVVRRMALKTGFVDVPSARKIHSNPIPLGGGIAVFFGFVVVVSVLAVIMPFGHLKAAIGIIAGAILIFLIGIYDDAFEMGAMPKLIGQIIAALIFLSFAQDAPPRMSYPVYLALGIFWIVGIQNALNFLDNMDGLCAGVALSIAIGLGTLFVFKDMSIYAIICFALVGGALGFLRYNLPPAGIFLGDTGSLLFGYILSCLALVHINSSRDMAGTLAPFIIMAYPIFDMTFVTISRLNEGRRVYIGGKDHSSHKISFMGLTRKATVFAILGINMLLVCFGIIVYLSSDSPYQTLFIVILATILAFTGTHLYKNILFLKQRIQLISADFIAVNAAIMAYVFIRYVLGLADSVMPLALSDLAWINIFWIVLYAAGGLYDLQPESRLKDHVASLSRVIVFAAAVFAIINFVPERGFQVSLGSLSLFSALLLGINSIFRAAYYSRTGKLFSSLKPAIDAVIARPSRSNTDQVLRSISSRYNILGYVGAPGECDHQHLGDLESLGQVLRARKVARVILDIPDHYFDSLIPIFNSAFFMDTRFLTTRHSLPSLQGLRKISTRLEGIHFVASHPRKIYFRIIKRTFDFAISGAILALTSPWILYKTLYGRIININLATKITIVGLGEQDGILRLNRGTCKFRFPWGLLSVFRGHLSLVGPTISTRDEYHVTPGMWRKFTVKPGLFGPGYNGSNKSEQFQLDLQYLEKPSLIFELWILARQLTNIFRLKGSGLKDA